MQNLVLYLGRGTTKSAEYEEIGQEDPIKRMWVFKPVTVAGFDGTDQM